MIDIEHKVLTSIKNNLGNIGKYLKDKENIKALMEEHLTIDSWTREDKMTFYQSIAYEALTKYDINEIMMAISEFKYTNDSDDIDIYMFKAIIDNFACFLEKVYELYLLDQLYFLLASCSKDFIMDPNNILKPLKTGSNLEALNFEISLAQMSLISNEEDVEIRLYNNKRFYLDRLNDLFMQKTFLHKKAYLNETLKNILCSFDDNYFVTQLFFILNSRLDPIRKKRSKKEKVKNDDVMQLVLKDFK